MRSAWPWATNLDDLPEDEGQIFVVVGDGELNEGQNWEAIMSASHFGLHRITAILDRNHFQNDGPGDEIMRIDPVGDKWAAFGWGVQYVDGHDVAAVRNALLTARARNDAPQVVICETVKGAAFRSWPRIRPAGTARDRRTISSRRHWTKLKRD